MQDQEAQYWESVGADWNRSNPDALWREHSDAVNLQALARWLPESCGRRLLKTDVFDEAFGRGLHPFLASRSTSVVGMDLSAEVARAARARNPQLRLLRADVRHLPFAGGAFDAIVSNSTLDHFRTMGELEASLRELHRVLLPGGRLILTMDNPVNPLVALRNALPFAWLHRLRLVPYYVGITFGPRRLRALLETVGFEVAETGALMHCPRVLAVPACRLLRKRAGEKTQRRWQNLLMRFERLSQTPLRFLTGNFIAILAMKPPASPPAEATPRCHPPRPQSGTS
jgi:SAM-dependent methyltransferase